MSNLETLLTAWLTDGTIPDDFQPETRIEEYLVAILDGVDDDVTPESRADVLLDAIAAKYAGYADGITALRQKLGLDTRPEFDEATTPQLIALAQDFINGIALADLADKGATGVDRNTLAILDAYSTLPSGGGEIFKGSAVAGTFAMIDVTSAATIGINITATAVAALTE